MKPPLAYYGSKVIIAPRIAALLPEHRHYVEPFAGSLAILLAKRQSFMETVNDLDCQVMAFWRVLRDRPADLERVCALTPHSRAEYTLNQEALRLGLPVPGDHPDPELEQARRVWVVLTQGRAGTLCPTGWRHHTSPAGANGLSMPGYLTSYRDRMHAAAQRLARVSLECRPALDVIEAYGRHSGVLLYVDPPYLAATRTSVQYRHEMPHAAEHRELAAALRDSSAAVVLSGYASPLYDDLYDGWYRHEIATVTTQGGQRGARREVLWSNRPFRSTEGTIFDLEDSHA